MPDSVISESLSSIVLASGNAGMNGYTTNSFGGNPAEYGSLYLSTYLAFPSGTGFNTSSRFNNFMEPE
ncbi:MAG: hypothetical protein E6I06_06895 [Chloroflexi bacterium]|nr:MAG: hypothetical protein E6I06_06895 [Chloroflexota bacterium]TMG16196.1 MAG: hypothetical protein E6H99_14910 [Chloroflexota bacterium]TMG64327.1 MAG: hypothetical protein E6H82_14765 [Chloroflexota bacterium]